MIRDDLTPMQYRIRFVDAGVVRVHYGDDRHYYEQLVARHGHLNDLRIEPLVLTDEQLARLAEIQGAGLGGHDAGIYVRYATTEREDTGHFDSAKLTDYRRDQAEPAIKAQRQAAEARGVTLNGVRYDGDPGNRQALSEALQAADDDGRSVFAAWKDSDGHYHVDHPVADVEAALRKIGQRRSALIALEGQYVAQVAAGQADSLALDWSTDYD